MKQVMSMAKGIKVFQSTAEILQQSHANPLLQNKNYLAFYNGAINSIITDKAFMNLWVDDKIVHKGFAVFDTLNIVNNCAYLLDKHLTRFESSAKRLGLTLPYPTKRIGKILLSLAAYTGKTNVAVRYWCSRGPGALDFLSTCKEPSVLYAVATEKGLPKPFNGTSEKTVPSNPVPAYIMEQVKLTSTVGYLAKMNPEKLSLVIDENGYIKPNPYYTPAFVMNNGVLSLPICYAEPRMAFNMEDRVAEIAQEILVPQGHIKEVVMETQNVDHYKQNSVEAFIINDINIKNVKELDGKKYNSHKIAELIRNLLNKEFVDPKYSVNVNSSYESEF